MNQLTVKNIPDLNTFTNEFATRILCAGLLILTLLAATTYGKT